MQFFETPMVKIIIIVMTTSELCTFLFVSSQGKNIKMHFQISPLTYEGGKGFTCDT